MKSLLEKTKLTAVQNDAVSHLYEHDRTLLVAPTGAGKTAITLTVLSELMLDKVLTNVVVVCPPKVVGVWQAEAVKWRHLQGMPITELVGTPSERDELAKNDGIHVVSINNAATHLKKHSHKYDAVVLDELSKMAGKSLRVLSTKCCAHIEYRVGLTATPVSQDFQKLFGQVKLIDGGKALGTNKVKFLDRFFTSDYMGYNFELRSGADKDIMSLIASLVYVVEDTKLKDLPAVTERNVEFAISDKALKMYKDLEKDYCAGDVECANAAVLTTKLRQCASGFCYDNSGGVVELDTIRAEVCADVMNEQSSALVIYEYQAQADMLCAELDTRGIKYMLASDDLGIARFKRGDCKYLIAQYQSLSHGVDGLQKVSSTLIFYHPIWSNDATQQAIGRLWRTGQTENVDVITLVAKQGRDNDVLLRVDDRKKWHEIFTSRAI